MLDLALGGQAYGAYALNGGSQEGNMEHRAPTRHFQVAIETIGQRWTGAIIRSMLAGTTRFTELRESVPHLSDRLLWERLKTLEEHGLVERQVVNRRHTEYTLTEKGRALAPVIEAVAAWAEEWLAPRRSPRTRPRAGTRGRASRRTA